MKDLISVIVPVYNVRQYLEKCLNSIVNQTYRNLEIILVDDGSTDGSSEICDEFKKKDTRIVVLHKINEGVSIARNCGLKIAKGDFVAFVDSDDFVQPRLYEKLIKEQKEHDYDWVFSRFNNYQNNKFIPVCEDDLSEFCLTGNLKFLLTHPHCKVKHNCLHTKHNVNCLIWRILFKKETIGDIRFYENINYMEDVLFLTELLLKTKPKLGYVNDCLYNYRVRDNSLSNGGVRNLINKCQSFINVFEKISDSDNFKRYVDAEKFFAYYICVSNQIKYGLQENLLEIKHWNKRENYLRHKKLCNGLISRLKALIIHYNWLFLLKIGVKLTSWRKNV